MRALAGEPGGCRKRKSKRKRKRKREGESGKAEQTSRMGAKIRSAPAVSRQTMPPPRASIVHLIGDAAKTLGQFHFQFQTRRADEMSRRDRLGQRAARVPIHNDRRRSRVDRRGGGGSFELVSGRRSSPASLFPQGTTQEDATGWMLSQFDAVPLAWRRLDSWTRGRQRCKVAARSAAFAGLPVAIALQKTPKLGQAGSTLP